MRYMQWLYSSGFSGAFSLLFSILGCGTLLQAQPVSSCEPTSRERSLQAASFAQEKLWFWQKRLNLEDWDISVLVSRSTELKPKTLGNIHWDLDKKTAVIRILDPADYKLPFKAMLQDMEFTVVHELIHLDLAPVLTDLQRSEANRREEEHAVNHVADALLKLEREQ